MLKIALTGNIASGKSAVQKSLENYGLPVLDTDIICHELLNSSVEIKEAFSSYDILENGSISRTKLGKLVFNNPELKTQLENLLYPDLICEIKSFFETNNSQNAAFVAIPQLFEAGMENLFDKIILVYCEDKIRLERLIKRNNFSIEYAQKRIDSQINQELKVSKSDYIIYNNSDLQALEKEVSKLIEQIH